MTSYPSTRSAAVSPLLAPIAAAALAILALPLALLAAVRPELVPALALLIVVALSAARVEFPILLLVATALPWRRSSRLAQAPS